MLRMALSDLLKESERDIQCFESGQQLLDHLHLTPDVILLDIEMPGVNGIEICRQIRDRGYADVQIIFVSAYDNLTSRIQAYLAGGNDYLTKPVEGTLLQGKLLVAESVVQQQHSSQRNHGLDLPRAAEQATAMSFMSILQGFMSEAFASETIDSVVKALFRSLHQFGVSGLLEIRQEFEVRRYSRLGHCTPLESSLLRHAATLGRIYQTDQILVLNFPVLTLLINQEYHEDPERYQRLREYLELLGDGANARLVSLEQEQAKAAAQQDVFQRIVYINDQIAQQLAQQQSCCREVHQLIQNPEAELPAPVRTQMETLYQQGSASCQQLETIVQQLAAITDGLIKPQ